MAEPFTRLTSIAAPLLRDNVDTDAIIPSREMTSTGKTGLADGLFAGWRYIDATRTPNPDFVLNQPQYRDAALLLGGRNFGCGSSREHAVWALVEYGIRCIVAPSFAPIFQSNCVRNGIVPVVLPTEAIAPLAGVVCHVDLVAQTVSSADATLSFDIEGEARAMLLEGLDAIDLTLKHRDAIQAFHARDRSQRPWVYLEQNHA
ncbi:3-isopropylmalate dehydratase small subunit [Blastomonas sp.]|uniref:3-isopropylmalate dehydratase small subunit n=1 Tax=Blastomonas sp. TaxID=1909299 RepID=UPI00262C67CC|nr:3-isopropylmalate dehydratase small subunit [Blastomonas sp.]MDM7957478.1 3-isopropylmalate dehydratase small subunit [Blastomonas sp.]